MCRASINNIARTHWTGHTENLFPLAAGKINNAGKSSLQNMDEASKARERDNQCSVEKDEKFT